MNVAVIVATCGDHYWADLAHDRAIPSAIQETVAWFDRKVHIDHHPTLSVAEARNTSAAEAASDWLCFLDADDELESGYLDAMLLAWEEIRPGTAEHLIEAPLLVPAVRYIRPPFQTSPAKIPNKGRWPEVNEAVIGTLVPRHLFERVGGFRDHTDDGTTITLYEDWDLWLRCWDAGAQLVRVEDAVYRAHVTPEGRNAGAEPSKVYDAIWRDHVARRPTAE